jgi:hypothetical protein
MPGKDPPQDSPPVSRLEEFLVQLMEDVPVGRLRAAAALAGRYGGGHRSPAELALAREISRDLYSDRAEACPIVHDEGPEPDE